MLAQRPRRFVATARVPPPNALKRKASNTWSAVQETRLFAKLQPWLETWTEVRQQEILQRAAEADGPVEATEMATLEKTLCKI